MITTSVFDIAGRYCEWQHNTIDKSAEIETFEEYKKTLHLFCDDGQPAILNWTVPMDAPDLLYYQVRITAITSLQTSLHFLICIFCFFRFSVIRTEIWDGKSLWKTREIDRMVKVLQTFAQKYRVQYRS